MTAVLPHSYFVIWMKTKFNHIAQTDLASIEVDRNSMPTCIASCPHFFLPEHYTPNRLFVSHPLCLAGLTESGIPPQINKNKGKRV
jgi:hypothetical protein